MPGQRYSSAYRQGKWADSTELIVVTQEPDHSPLYLQGELEGQIEARELLTETAQQKGSPLTTTEIRHRSRERFQLRLKQWQEHAVVNNQFRGWCMGFGSVWLDAEKDAPDPEGLWRPFRAIYPY